ncbi:MAG: ROK family protein [Bryobacteraceae bacterium]
MISIGVLATTDIRAGVVEANRLAGAPRVYPEPGAPAGTLQKMHAEQVLECIREQVEALAGGNPVGTVGVGFPGIIRNGVVEDSPNLAQMKGYPLAEALRAALAAVGIPASVRVLNSADALAAGLAATRGRLGDLIRVWYLGEGVGFGRYPQQDVPWEGGHMVVSLDPKERYCGCGGRGHLEGIVGSRSIRLRFLDLEPEEVFAAAADGDARAAEFVRLWHRALAAGCATSVHLEGPGRFFLAGPNAPHVNTGLLGVFMHEMISMTPLQGSFVEVVATGHEIALIGAAVHAAASIPLQ